MMSILLNPVLILADIPGTSALYRCHVLYIIVIVLIEVRHCVDCRYDIKRKLSESSDKVQAIDQVKS